MGFYLINNRENKPSFIFVDKLEDLIYHVEGNIDDTVIVKGSRESKPFFLKDSNDYKNLCDQKYRNGLLAQEIFKNIARERRFMIESIPQDIDSFSVYNILDSFTIKRADFVIKNCRNIEVDVKCLSFYLINDKKYFYIRYSEIMKLERMNSLIEKNTILAIFDQNTVRGQDFSLNMIELKTILKENNRCVVYDQKTKCFKVPLHLTTNGFDLLEEYRINRELY
ncbi:hypothetical protein [Chryseobacterium sp. W4I1]|uniref:hypothetical protein n=1 Tax=Chryseobacterium sp. W4I1 TaxID=3042293 RepID=UPI0027842CB6|nr:hypothetical protein [Chryseobacterium sp. W4I1]MDQ0781359.1 hypothetical protein [Chryseobacterium sp. W4I1]